MNPKITIDKGVTISIKNIHDWYDAPIWTKNQSNTNSKMV